ncbi:MAG: autotransporter outer membrane beta-barrel domain-containing protein, partial [Paracoccaceae bacterium]
SGDVRTRGEGAVGLLAQALGGGGGEGSTVVTGAVSGGGAGNMISVGVGGAGGTGAAGGDVTVVNGSAGSIATVGDSAHGILAMSVGGGGGRGGVTVTSNLADGDARPGDNAVAMALSLGGAGGAGGIGGNVIVENAGAISTEGVEAHAIVAQSVGGGGGRGSLVVNGDLTLGGTDRQDPSLRGSSIAVGGAGGDGERAGDVTVRNDGAIRISGRGSRGILAQSVGGGGGDGGAAASLSRSASSNPVDVLARSLLDIGVGGTGGAGGDGGDVLVEHTGRIVSEQADSYGIFAQSVAGGGGSVGASVSGPTSMAADLALSALVGGRDGAAGLAGEVEVVATGDIVMNAPRSRARFAQAVNGGGGDLDLFLDVARPAVGAGAGAALEARAKVSGAVALGADGAEDAVGAAVTGEHEGALFAKGAASVASLTQSVGGGGGDAVSRFALDPRGRIDLTLRLGAVDTDGSAGGDVTVSRVGPVGTVGRDAPGEAVQSVGGGGGRLVAVVTGGGRGGRARADLTLGSDPSFSNPGGDLDLKLDGDAGTEGDRSPALLLQSVGAGGGQTWLTGTTSARVLIGAQDGSSGDGGDVRATNRGAVTTRGALSDGVVLQSVGGGGGYVLTDLTGRALTVEASPDNAGDGGDLSFTQIGTIHVVGDRSIGLLAQSLGGGGGKVDDVFLEAAGGAGVGGDVAVSVVGDVIADARGGVAVFAQSKGRDGAGSVRLDLDGVVKGGAGGSEAAAIVIDGGAANRVRLGREGFVFAASRRAMTGGSGDETVVSDATLVGDVDLGGGRNRYRNRAAGVLHTGAVFDLGRGGLLTSAGVLSPGGRVADPETPLGVDVSRAGFVVNDRPQVTDLTGSLHLLPRSRFEVDAGFRVSGEPGEGSDLVRVSGSAAIDGTVAPTLVTLERALPLTIVDPVTGSVDAGAEVLDTATIDYSILLNGPTGDGVTIDLVARPDFSLDGMTANQAAVGEHVNSILTGEGSAALGRLFAFIGNMTEAAEVIETVDRLTVEGFAASRVDTLLAGERFADAVTECERASSNRRLLPSGRCVWFDVQGVSFERRAGDGFKALDSDSIRILGGFQAPIAADWSAAVAGGWEGVDLGSGGRFRSEGNRGHLGVALTRGRGPWTLGAIASGSYGRHRNDRVIGVSGLQVDGRRLAIDEARSTTDALQANLRLSAEGEFALPADPRFYATPSLRFDAGLVHTDGVRETGVGSYGVEVAGADSWVLSVTPSLEIGGRFPAAAGAEIRPYLRGGATVYGDDEMEVRAAFLGAPPSAGRFRNASGFDQVVGRVALGVVIENDAADVSLRVGYEGTYGAKTTGHAARASLSFRF